MSCREAMITMVWAPAAFACVCKYWPPLSGFAFVALAGFMFWEIGSILDYIIRAKGRR